MKQKYLNMISDNISFIKKIFYNKSFYFGIIISSVLLFFSSKNFDSNKFFDAIKNVEIFKNTKFAGYDLLKSKCNTLEKIQIIFHTLLKFLSYSKNLYLIKV